MLDSRSTCPLVRTRGSFSRPDQRGEDMEGDFTRNSDEPSHRYSGVLMQQGRVLLDADWNEQWAIQTRSIRTALSDLIGQHGGPALPARDDDGDGDPDDADGGSGPDPHQPGFALLSVAEEGGESVVTLNGGSYYVDGIRLTLPEVTQVFWELEPTEEPTLVYLEVFERHVNVVEDPGLREVALMGPDTTTRAQILWRLGRMPVDIDSSNVVTLDWADDLVAPLRERVPFLLEAQANPAAAAEEDPCEPSLDAMYRGHDNQLYRVEIHAIDADGFWIKWSRENGSVVIPLEVLTSDLSDTVTLNVKHLGRDARTGLKANDVVELVDGSAQPPRSPAWG